MTREELQAGCCRHVEENLGSGKSFAAPPGVSGSVIGGAVSSAVIATLVHTAVNAAVDLIQKPVEDWESAHAAQIQAILGNKVIGFIDGLVSAVKSHPVASS